MGTKETPIQRGRRRGSEITRASVTRLREARVVAGVSQAALAERVGTTQAWISRFEAHKFSHVSVLRLAEIASILGLEPALSFHPVGSAIRDKGHEALIKRLSKLLSANWTLSREVPFPNDGDPRSWDALLKLVPNGQRAGMEAETRIRDLQALTRRMKERGREGGVDVVVIVLSDSAANRALFDDFRAALGADFAHEPREIRDALANGTRLPGAGVLLI